MRRPIPGFGKHPPWARPEAAYFSCPFPIEFLHALCRVPEYQPKPIPKPFTKAWRERWLSFAFCYKDRAGHEQARENCAAFFTSQGLTTLQELTQRGCDPNFVMSLFTRYLWNPDVREQEYKDGNLQMHRDGLAAIKTTRDLLACHTWVKSPKIDVAQRVLGELETTVQSYHDELDCGEGRGLQNDKQNRVIFAIHCHLEVRNIGHQWLKLMNLLKQADAITFGKTKRKSDDVTNDSPDRRIKPRLDSFKADHPKEAAAMPKWVIDWPADIKTICPPS
jgi:hypothetical protein